MLGINLFLYKNTKVSLLQNCPSFNDYVILCAAARVNTLRVSSFILQSFQLEKSGEINSTH